MTERAEPKLHDSDTGRRTGPSYGAVFLGAVLAIVACVVLYRIRSVFLPFIIGLLAAYVLDPALGLMTRRGMSRAGAVWVVVGAFVMLLAVVALTVVPVVVVQVQQFAHHFPDLVGKLENLYFDAKEELNKAFEARQGQFPIARRGLITSPADPAKAAENATHVGAEETPADSKPDDAEMLRRIKRAATVPPTVSPNVVDVRGPGAPNLRTTYEPETVAITEDAVEPSALAPDASVGERVDSLVEQLSQKATEFLPTALTRVGAWLWSSITSVLILIIVPFIAFYALRDIEAVRNGLLGLVPEPRRASVQNIGRKVNLMLGAYLRGLTLVCLMLAAASTAMLYTLSAFFGIEYCLLVGILTGITYAVPYIGPATAALTAGAVGYATANHDAILCGILALVLQVAINQVFDSFVMPRIVGQKVGLHPLLVIFALMSGFHLWGVLGMIVAVPLAASIKISVQELYPALAPGRPPPTESIKGDTGAEPLPAADEPAADGASPSQAGDEEPPPEDAGDDV
jgi:predicted PurR-regulated permease PerM